MDRYYAETIKGRGGFPTLHIINDRRIFPPFPCKLAKSKAGAIKLAKKMSDESGPWTVPAARGHHEELRRLREWAANSPAMNTNNREMALVTEREAA